MKSFSIPLVFTCTALISLSFAVGVRKEVENRYKQQYVNRALTLKQPVRSQEQGIIVGSDGGRLDPTTLGSRLMFRVGDQVRITEVDFRDHEIRFDLESPDRTRRARLTFRFSSELTHSFPQQSAFDSALENTFTEALSYREIESAKQEYIQSEFNEMVRRFIGTTSTSSEFVMRALADLNPQYQGAIADATAAQRRAEQLQQQLEEAQRRSLDAGRQLEEAKRESAASESRLSGLRQDNDQLRSRTADLQREVGQLESSNAEYQQQIQRLERQINAVADKLDLELANRDQLGEQVENLTQSLDSLQQERGSLSDQLSRVNVQLGQLQDERARLAGELEASEQRHSRLQRNYNRLTGDKNSVTARLAETTEARDRLQNARELESILDVEAQIAEFEEGPGERVLVRLGEHDLGAVEIAPPSRIGTASVVRLHLDSPETVAFSERERELFESLGDSWKVEALWRSETDSIHLEPGEGDAVQVVPPRESAVWQWRVTGETAQPARVALKLTLIDSNDQRIELLERDYLVRPAGVTARLAESFSWLSLAVGGLLGAGVVAFMRRPRAAPAAPRTRRPDGSKTVRKGL